MPNGDGGFITIQPREIFDALRRVEAKVDMLAAKEATITDHEARIRVLESRFAGVAVGAVTLVFASIGAIVWKIVGS